MAIKAQVFDSDTPSVTEFNNSLATAMIDQKTETLTASSIHTATADSGYSGDTVGPLLGSMILDNLFMQLLIVGLIALAVTKLLLIRTGSTVAARNADKGRKLVGASARIDALCERGEELEQLKKALQDDVMVLRKENASLNGQLKAGKNQALKAKSMIKHLKICLTERDSEGGSNAFNIRLQQSQGHASYLRRMLQLPAKYHCHVEL